MANLFQSKFFKTFLSLLTGSLLAQLITIGVTPITTRLFMPENYGVFSLFTIIVGLFSQIGSLCYDRAIILPKKDVDSIHLFFLSIFILFASSIVLFIVAFFFNEKIAAVLNNQEFSLWILMVPVGVLITGLNNILKIWRLRNNHTKIIAVSRVWEAIISALIKIGAGFFIGAFSGGLILSTVTSGMLAIPLLALKPEPFKFKADFKKFSMDKASGLALKYKQFPYFSTLNFFLNYSSRNITVFLFSIFFPPAVLGYYSLCDRIVRLPVNIISRSVQNAYFQKSSMEIAYNKKILRGFLKTTLFLLAIGTAGFGVLAIGTHYFFSDIFGQSWAPAKDYILILIPWFFMLFLGSPSNIIYETCRKQDAKLIFNIFIVVIRISVLVTGNFLYHNPQIVLIMFVAANMLIECFLIVYAVIIIKKYESGLLRLG
jgi:O-antigen/teichoic acid export membrane protein